MNSNSRKDIIDKNKEFIRKNKLEPYLETILNPLFDQTVIDDKLTVQEYLEQNKVPKEQVNMVFELYNTILNDNHMISGLIEYNVDNKSLMNTLVNTVYVDNLRNSMFCIISSDKQVLGMLLQQIVLLINTPKVEICTKEKFIEYCDKNYFAQIKASKVEPKVKVTTETKPTGETKVVGEVINKQEIEKFANELEETKKEIDSGTMKILDIEKQLLPLIDNNPKFMDAKSISDIMNSFNEKSYGPDVEKQLKVLIDRYQSKYGKVNLIEIKEFGNLVKMLIDELKLIIQRLIEEDDMDKLKVIIGDFNAHKKIFYFFKHNYKIVQAYQIINKEVSDNDKKLRAMLCCSKTGTTSCHNFSNIAKNPTAIIFGFNNLGYAKTIKCIKDSDEANQLIAEQEKTVDDILSSRYEMWKKISKDEKMVIMNNFDKLLKINGVNILNINGKIGDIRQELAEQKKLNFVQLTRTLYVKPSDISKFFKLSGELALKLDQVMKFEKIKDIQDFINKQGFNKKQVIFNTNVNLDYAKKITIDLMTAQEVLFNFNYKDNADTVAKLFSIMETSESFGEILNKTPIQSRYHTIIVEYLMKTIESGKYAVIQKYDMKSVPNDVIKYLQSKPSDINLNICRVRGEILQKLRRDRTINLKEFDEYDKQLEILCNPSKVEIKDIISNKIPIDSNKGLPVVERKHVNYDEFIKEHKQIEKYNLKTEVVSDEILYNFMKNTYN
jgi:hypothetical protein